MTYRTEHLIWSNLCFYTHRQIKWSELFSHEWWASDGSDLITPVVCPLISYPPFPCLSPVYPLLPQQSISLWKWHFKRLIAFWPSLSASDRWRAEGSVMVLHVSRISQHRSWSPHEAKILFRFVVTTWSLHPAVDRKWMLGDVFKMFVPSGQKTRFPQV